MLFEILFAFRFSALSGFSSICEVMQRCKIENLAKKNNVWNQSCALHRFHIITVHSTTMFLVQAEMKSFVFVQTSRVICSSDLPESILSSHSANIRISQQNIAQRLRMAQVENTTRFSAAIHTDEDTLMLIIDAFCNKLSPSNHEDTEGRHWDYWQRPIRDRSLNDLKKSWKKRKLSFKWCANIMLSIHITSYC